MLQIIDTKKLSNKEGPKQGDFRKAQHKPLCNGFKDFVNSLTNYAFYGSKQIDKQSSSE